MNIYIYAFARRFIQNVLYCKEYFFSVMHCLEIKIMTLALRMQCSAEFLYYENLPFKRLGQ